ncbi:MAG: RagB/SusD family nutrient uptake outer membrane protein [Candidatus Kapaibacterium sp.]
MKRIKDQILRKARIILPVMMILGITLTSCDIPDYINESPNAITEENVRTVDGVNGLFIGMQVAVADFTARDHSRIPSVWTWQLGAPPGIARAQMIAWNGYQQNRDGETDDMWLMAYRGVKLCNDLIAFTPDVIFSPTGNTQIQNTIIGAAKTYKAYFLGELAAFYGSIPIDIVGIEPSQFVSQDAAYAEVQRLLDEALVHFADAGPVERDLNFGGDGAMWTEAANSIKARYALHTKDYQNALTYANSGISSADGNLYGIYNDAAGEYASWGMWVQNEGEPLRAEMTFVRLLKREDGDARLAEYFTPAAAAEGEYYGYAVHPGKETNATEEERDIEMTARMNKYSGFDEDFPVIRYAENLLIRAECKARTGDLPGAVSDVDIVRTMNGLPELAESTLGIDVNDQAAVIQEILDQKHMELYLEAQSYHDMRRTGTMPDPVPETNFRFIYPESELNANPYVPADNDNLVYTLLSDDYK